MVRHLGYTKSDCGTCGLIGINGPVREIASGIMFVLRTFQRNNFSSNPV